MRYVRAMWQTFPQRTGRSCPTQTEICSYLKNKFGLVITSGTHSQIWNGISLPRRDNLPTYLNGVFDLLAMDEFQRGIALRLLTYDILAKKEKPELANSTQPNDMDLATLEALLNHAESQAAAARKLSGILY